MVAALALTLLATTPLVIAHRGASGERPEHTLEAYRLAIAQGADYIEPDLVITQDGVLIARHENELSKSTNVADLPEFASRKTTKRIDGKDVSGWFAEDFTLDEIKRLRARQTIALRGNAYDDKYSIPTFAEVLDLIAEKPGGRTVGVYPETKHPTFFREIGLPLEEPLLATLSRYGYKTKESKVFIQSFEVGNLKRLREKTTLKLVQLLDSEDGPYDLTGTTYASMLTPDGLKEIRTYADGIGVAKALVFPRTDGRIGEATPLVRDAKAAGLAVHVWTFRNEGIFLPKNYANDPAGELKAFFAAGIDGVFSDFPATAVKARPSH